MRFKKKSSLYKADVFPTPYNLPKHFILESDYDGIIYTITLTKANPIKEFRTYMYEVDIDRFDPINLTPPEPPNSGAFTAVWMSMPPSDIHIMNKNKVINHNAIKKKRWTEISESDYTKLFLTMDREELDDRFE